ncbi:hypothetical protein GCM10022220_14050 [Actinocatenispora rupis]
MTDAPSSGVYSSRTREDGNGSSPGASIRRPLFGRSPAAIEPAPAPTQPDDAEMSTARLRPSAADRVARVDRRRRPRPAEAPEPRREPSPRPRARAIEAPRPAPRSHSADPAPRSHAVEPAPRSHAAEPEAPERPRTRAEERAAREAARGVDERPRTRAEERAAREAAERDAAEREMQHPAGDRGDRATRAIERAEARGRARPGVAPTSGPPTQPTSAPPAPRTPEPRAPQPRAPEPRVPQPRVEAEPDDDRDVVQGSHRRDPRVVLELRVIGMVVRREFKKYFRSKAKILSSFVQPFFFLLIFGYGMRTLVRTTGGASFEQFVFPGVIAMTVLGRALLSAVTIVQDREHGFLREMLVSPASRVSIVIGSILGGAGISTIQAVLLFFGAPIMGLFPGPATIVKVLATTALMAVEVTALGVALATFIQKPNSFTAVTQALTYPMLVLSGALVPLAGLPSWVAGIARFNLFSYPVDATRRLLIGSDVKADKGSLVGLVLFGHPMSVGDEIALTAGCTLVFVLIAAWRFARVA